MRTSAPVRALAVLAAAAAGLVLAAPADALPAEPTAPVVTNDSVALWPYGSAVVDVLANDTDPGDPDGSQLGLCRVPEFDFTTTVSSSAPVSIADLGQLFGSRSQLMVTTTRKALPTPVDVDYYVCNYSFLAPAKITVTTRTPAPVLVRKVPGKPGRLKVTNRNDSRIQMIWSGRTKHSGGSAPVRAHASKVVRVTGKTIRWFAMIGGSTNSGVAGHGAVHGIKIDPAAATKPSKGDPLGDVLGDLIDALSRRFLG